MRTIVDISEFPTYLVCPEKERRRRLSPTIDRFQERLRTILVRFYGELLGGIVLSEAELRRSWGRMWDIDTTLQTRKLPKFNQSITVSLMTDEEKLLINGASIINKLVNRASNKLIKPVIVDEPFTLEYSEGFQIGGRYDMVFEDSHGNYIIVDWTTSPTRYRSEHDLKHAVLIEAFKSRTGKSAGLVVDYIRTTGDFMLPSPRTQEELAKQVIEAGNIASGIAKGLYYRRIENHCKVCPYQADCLGERVVKAQRPRSLTRTGSLSGSE